MLAFIIAQIGLGQHQTVGDGNLLYRFGLALKGAEAVYRIDGRDHTGKRETLAEPRIAHQRVQDRGGIGKPARLDHHALERLDAPIVAPRQQLLERGHQIAAHLAAKAPRLQLYEALLTGFDEVMVERNLTELID